MVVFWLFYLQWRLCSESVQCFEILFKKIWFLKVATLVIRTLYYLFGIPYYEPSFFFSKEKPQHCWANNTFNECFRSFLFITLTSDLSLIKLPFNEVVLEVNSSKKWICSYEYARFLSKAMKIWCYNPLACISQLSVLYLHSSPPDKT